MGDVAMLPHALRALKEAYPEVKVTVATKSLFHPFFEGVDVDFLDIETRRTHRGIRGAIRFAREAAELKIDAVADMHNVLRSKMVRAALHLRGYSRFGNSQGADRKIHAAGTRFGRCETFETHRHPLLRRLPSLGIRLSRSPAGRETAPDPIPWEKNRVYGSVSRPFSAQPGKTYPENVETPKPSVC